VTFVYDEEALWRKCEQAWGNWLQARGYLVMRLGDAIGNTSRSSAPLIGIGDDYRRAPDLQTAQEGKSEYWEIKFRTRPFTDPLTGTHHHWMGYAAFRDYLEISDRSGFPVWVVLYEGATALSDGRWLIAEIHALQNEGRREARVGNGGDEVDAWVWPVTGMKISPGPAVEAHPAETPLLPEEGETPPAPPTSYAPLERSLRQPAAAAPEATATAADVKVLESEAEAGLDVLSRSLGIPVVPHYSVLRLGDGVDLDDLLGLLDYGIRLFLVTSERTEEYRTPRLQAFEDGRLLEWAVVEDLPDVEHWTIDGDLPDPLDADLEAALQAADIPGGINVGQYRIVHAPADADVLVTAGAGTGKTETMAERMIFLLATSRPASADDDPAPLRADDFALITFTREAAQEMRSRISRSLLLRQRLSKRCVLPALPWMLQLGNARISTIHAFAKSIVQEAGGAVGVGPGFNVSDRRLELRAFLQSGLSEHLQHLFTTYEPNRIPAAYQWQSHLEQLWDSLGNNGVELLPGPGDGREHPVVDWGTPSGDALEIEMQKIIHDVLRGAAASFGRLSREDQILPTAQLIPTALSSLRAQEEPPTRSLRYLFVDEFQDTDSLQIDLLLAVRERVGARLFVVGDPKQGIYRFRGAAGNAFQELENRVAQRGEKDFMKCDLNRNFRSGARLLGDLHPNFSTWGAAGLLPYGESDELRPGLPSDSSLTIALDRGNHFTSYASDAARTVAAWRAAYPRSSIGILCRRNKQARDVQRAVRHEQDLPCDLAVGGSFYKTPAVRELRAFLHAVMDPGDDAALLELCETRWSAGLFSEHALIGPPEEGVWDQPVGPLMAWADRVAALGDGASFHREDLDVLRRRVFDLRRMLTRMPVLAWLVECERLFTPAASALPQEDDETERKRYERCFEHLLTLLVATFEDSPATLETMYEWLTLQIATNTSEDEPFDAEDAERSITALTVHKAKGLEFDRVLIPVTWTEFGADWTETNTALLSAEDADSDPRLMWKWKPGGGEYSNVGANEQDLWEEDAAELRSEEARLLYVAMTRARRELQIFLPSGGRTYSPPRSWRDLLLMNDGF
jgi:DNA helicase-2/ATP-dependent DNA helicase PcrA